MYVLEMPLNIEQNLVLETNELKKNHFLTATFRLVAFFSIFNFFANKSTIAFLNLEKFERSL